MARANVTVDVRHISPAISLIDIEGTVILFAEQRLMEAHDEAALPTTRVIILNFSGLDYMCGGIGLLILLLRHVTYQKQRLLSYGLSDHYRHIFTLTRFNEMIPIHESEAEALATQEGERVLMRHLPS